MCQHRYACLGCNYKNTTSVRNNNLFKTPISLRETGLNLRNSTEICLGNKDAEMVYAFKLMRQMEWHKFAKSLIFLGSEVDLDDGFIHLSYADQLAETARRHFLGLPELILCAVNCADLGEALKNEPSRHGQLFPHLYRPLHWREVFWHTSLQLGPDGAPVIPALPS